MTELKNRIELLFLYDIENANPNGDPNDENKPRIDEETGKNIVTDVRLKRTIRDYLFEKGNDIFVQEKVYDDDGHIQDAKLRAADYLPDDPEKLSELSAEQQKKEISNNILKNCIDVRLFGATIPLDLKVKKGAKKENVSGSLTYTGPVQFRVGKSLHSVKLQFFKGTGAFAAGKEKTQKTFREEYMLPYSLIGFYGIANENAGKHTHLSEDDIMLLKKAIWNGTKGLISRSKFGQMPRLLLSIRYNEPDYFIGELDNLVHLETSVIDTKIRRPEDYTIDISELVSKIEKVKDKIQSISFIADEKMQFSLRGEKVNLSDLGDFTNESTEVL
jgi:CRISPR-associated protein Csh2